MSNKRHALTIFSLTMITVGSVDSIRNLPATALFGSQLLVFFILGAIFFLIPTALISAELASAWPKQGGVYVWVKKAFGRNVGLVAIWLQWIENIIWYPTILSFVAGTIGYLINPSLTDNPLFLWLIITCSFWGATLVNLGGMRSSALMSNICAVSGLLIPMTLIISLGGIWIFGGNPLQIAFDVKSITPNLSDHSMWVSLTAIMLSFCGVEIATVHANDVHDPQHAFPKSLFYAVLIILSTLMLGSLAIAVVLPSNEISFVSGIMQAFNAFFDKYSMLWFMPIIGVMLVLGGLGGVNNWIIAPTKGLLIAAQDADLPMSLQRVNKQEAPVSLLIAQASIVTVLSSVFLFMPSVNGSYWFITALAAQLYMLMYLLMFLAAIKLRFKFPEHRGSFRIGRGNLGLLIFACMGIIGVLTTLGVSFIPPEGVNIGSVFRYETSLIVGLILMCSPPLILIYRKSKVSVNAVDLGEIAAG